MNEKLEKGGFEEEAWIVQGLIWAEVPY
jgi:hypothetical protein